MKILLELFNFLCLRKKLWLIPIITIMLMLNSTLILAQTSILVFFIYLFF